VAEDPRKLKDEAQKAQTAGKYKKALELYVKLAALDPTDAQWPQRAGDCLRKLERSAEAIQQFELAARIYAQRGFLVKAIAVAKIILQIDPSNTTAQEQVLALNTQRGIPVPVARVRPGSAPPPPSGSTPEELLPPEVSVRPAAPPPPPPAMTRPSIDPAHIDQPLAELDLRSLVPRTAPAMPALSIPGLVTGGGPPGARVMPELLPDAEDDRGPEDLDDGPPPSYQNPEARSSLPPGVVEIPTAQAPGPGIDQGLRRTPLFSDLSEQDLSELVARCEIEQREAGEIIIAEGEPGDAMYIIAEGSVRVLRGNPPVDLAQLGEGAFFGEIALATDAPRQASVMAAEPTVLLVVPRVAVNEVVRKSENALSVLIAFLRDRLVSGVLATAPLFKPFSPDERATIASKFRFLEARTNEPIVVEGERSRGLYVILVGSALAAKATSGGEQVLGTLKSGDVFGEMSLLNHEEAVATVRTTSKVWLLELPGRAFLELVMTHPQFLDYIGELADQRKRDNEVSLSGGARPLQQHVTFV
jgi:CRP-like cAMP-binding protein